MLHKSDYSSEGVPVVNPANIVNGQISIDKIMYVKKEKSLELSKYNLFLNDILLARRGDLSKCAIATSENIGWLCGTGSFVLHLCLIESYYFKLIYATQYIQSILATASVGATMDNLNQDTFSKILIPIPPLEEQKRIINGVHEWYNLIDSIDTNRKELSNAIEETKSRVLSLAISGKLVPQDPNDEPAIDLLRRINPSFTPCDTSHYENLPANWCVCTLNELYSHTTGKALKRSNQEGVLKRYITTSNLYWDHFDLTDVRSMYFTETELEKCTVKEGDLLVCNGGDVGRAAIWNYKDPICYQNHISRLRPRHDNLVENRFYYYIFMYLKGKALLNGKGVAITSLSATDILSLKVPFPPLAEQKRIVAALEKVFSQIDNITAEL